LGLFQLFTSGEELTIRNPLKKIAERCRPSARLAPDARPEGRFEVILAGAFDRPVPIAIKFFTGIYCLAIPAVNDVGVEVRGSQIGVQLFDFYAPVARSKIA
jgi:hypothetical protein